MKYNTLKNGFKISEVSFGCMSLKAENKENDSIISEAIAGGINLFDTADLYEKGANEKLLGTALKGKRNSVHISTKVGNRWKADGSGWEWCPRKEYILSAIDDSLHRLQTDYIDLYLLHGGTIDDPADEVIEAFERLVDSGKIRSYGISSIRPNVIREYVNRSNISAVMTQYSLLDRRPEEETLQLLGKNNIGVLARGSIASGLLAGKVPAPYLGLSETEVKNIQQGLLQKLPEGYTLGEGALRYVMDNPDITTAVAGIRTQQQLAEALAAEGKLPLTEKQRLYFQDIWTGNTYKEHR
ncbi:aldo/keto reductase [Flavobacterium psychrotrophum]|uniref:aldo/keto reductase n=1 Tax=Flavobacterium psychrotrophum TaxID=2294119 RepID=UPI000E313CBA|nr:aldo/keto reductase [Flavobacterium psychrotrophum]